MAATPAPVPGAASPAGAAGSPGAGAWSLGALPEVADEGYSHTSIEAVGKTRRSLSNWYDGSAELGADPEDGGGDGEHAMCTLEDARLHALQTSGRPAPAPRALGPAPRSPATPARGDLWATPERTVKRRRWSLGEWWLAGETAPTGRTPATQDICIHSPRVRVPQASPRRRHLAAHSARDRLQAAEVPKSPRAVTSPGTAPDAPQPVSFAGTPPHRGPRVARPGEACGDSFEATTSWLLRTLQVTCCAGPRVKSPRGGDYHQRSPPVSRGGA
uniref:Uncharacterized protein n=1 Tax=Alexandrium monilatum TaxID=311494 RepID=A0A7S4UVL1_9DINO|mmetsp:Transcript_35964/g.107425  ORF Transcript_35964/g.107425 Transcript_35964/m.107425 type:complete len:273 (+) Transcript_35964:23-841(+)